MIVDCFIYMNERDLLKARIDLLRDVVDRFVVVEATRTFQGQSRELDFPKTRLSLGIDDNRISYVVVDDLPVTDGPWACERHVRDSILRALSDVSPDAIILISDVDEIFRPEIIQTLGEIVDEPVALQMQYLTYRLNWCWDRSWRLPRAARRRDLGSPDGLRRRTDLRVVKDAGWHISWLGDRAAMVQKLQSFSHTELLDLVDAQCHLDRCLRLGVDFLGRGVLKDLDDSITLPTLRRSDFPDYWGAPRSTIRKAQAHLYNFAIPGLRRFGFKRGPVAFVFGLAVAFPGRSRATVTRIRKKVTKRARRVIMGLFS